MNSGLTDMIGQIEAGVHLRADAAAPGHPSFQHWLPECRLNAVGDSAALYVVSLAIRCAALGCESLTAE